MVGEYYGGGDSGFSSTEDGADLTVNVKLPDDAARNLWDVQAAIQQIASDLQTSVRAIADFNSYLISTREISQTIKMPNLGLEAGPEGNMSYSGGRVDSGSVLASSGEAGAAGRIAEMEENSSGAGGGAMVARAGRPVDVGGFIGNIANAGFQAEFAFRREQGHAGTYYGEPQAEETASRADRFAAASGGLRVTQSGRSGGGGHGIEHAAQVATQAAYAGRSFLGGSGMSAFASLFGRLGAIGAVGYGVYQIADAGLQTYAQSRALALSTNSSANGAGWGFDQRVGQAEMAMSPYISQEEAAAIYKTAVDQGWASGHGGGSPFAQGNYRGALNFMYDAAKNMNMDPSMSGQLLQTNVIGAGESITQLNEQLLTLKKTLDGTGISMAAMNATYTSLTGQLIGAGTDPLTASRIVGGALKSFSGNSLLGPTGTGASLIFQAMQGNAAQGIISGMTGFVPGTALLGSHADKSTAAMQQLVHQLAVQFGSGGGDVYNKAGLFMTAYNQIFTDSPINPEQALSLMSEAQSPDFVTKGQKDFVNNSTATYNSGDQGRSQFGVDVNWAKLWASSDDQQHFDDVAYTYRNYSPEVDALLKSAGGDIDKLTLYGPDGKPVKYTDWNPSGDGKKTWDAKGGMITAWMSDPENFKKFNDPKGGYYILDAKGNKINAHNIGLGGPDAGANAAANSANTVYITLSDQAKQWFATNVDHVTTGSSQANNSG